MGNQYIWDKTIFIRGQSLDLFGNFDVTNPLMFIPIHQTIEYQLNKYFDHHPQEEDKIGLVFTWVF